MAGGGSLSPVSPLHWFPLATEQLRLRSVSHVLLHQPEADLFHLTFHETALSSPFFSLPPARPVEGLVRWPELDHKEGDVMGAVRGVVVRLWSQSKGCLLVWGVGFSGLVCVGDHLARSVTNQLPPNTLVFKLHNHYFVTEGCELPPVRFLEVPCLTVESGKSSYDLSTLVRLQATLRDLAQSLSSNQLVKSEICARGLGDTPTSEVTGPGGGAVGSGSLRQKIFSVQLRKPGTRRREMALSRQIEELRLRTSCLRRERDRAREEVRKKRRQLEEGVVEVEETSNRLTDNMHTLAKDKEKLEVWLETFTKARDSNRKSCEALRLRRHQLIGQLSEIFPVSVDQGLPTICFVALPSSEAMREREDTDLAVGLGWAAHLTCMVSCLLAVPLRYPTDSAGSQSSVEDQILDKIPDKDRRFPLYSKGVDRVRFEYGVYLLNKNISQLRWYCGVNTPDLRPTLSNLAGLLSVCGGDKEDKGSSTPSPKFHLPAAPPGAVSQESASEDEICDTSDDKLTVENSDQVDSSEATTGDTSDEVNCDIERPAVNAGVFLVAPPLDAKPPFEVRLPVEDTPSSVVGPSEEIGLSLKIEPLPEVGPPVEVRPAPGDPSPALAHLVVEEAVEAADVFWDSVASRTLALSAPNTFKTHRPRHYK